MKNLRQRLQENRVRMGLPWEAMERDYVLSWVLAGLASQDELKATLVFKGGTCLRKCYGQDRFSEDLDFSTTGPCPQGDALESAIRDATRLAAALMRPFAPVQFEVQRYPEKEPHPEGQEAFAVLAQLPWHKRVENFTRVKVEVSRQESLLWAPQRRRVDHPYGETMEVEPLVYAPEEIAAEKLRAILQHSQRQAVRGWIRPRARDFYDLWCFLIQSPSLIIDDKAKFLELLGLKCRAKNVDFTGFDDFFPPGIIEHARSNWESSLGPVVRSLPPFDLVEADLKAYLENLFDD